MKTQTMVKSLNKKELASLIERVYHVPHRNVRITRRHGRTWHVHGERVVQTTDDGVNFKTRVTAVDLTGSTLLEAALSDAMLRYTIEHHAEEYQRGQDAHEAQFGKKVA